MLKQSMRKVEQACYSIQVRGSEIPKVGQILTLHSYGSSFRITSWIFSPTSARTKKRVAGEERKMKRKRASTTSILILDPNRNFQIYHCRLTTNLFHTVFKFSRLKTNFKECWSLAQLTRLRNRYLYVSFHLQMSREARLILGAPPSCSKVLVVGGSLHQGLHDKLLECLEGCNVTLEVKEESEELLETPVGAVMVLGSTLPRAVHIQKQSMDSAFLYCAQVIVI